MRRRLGTLWRRIVESTLLSALLVFAVALSAGVTGFYFLEMRPGNRGDFFDALWWAFVTVTTVGYGDIVPATNAGRILGMALMASGIGLLATISGNLASALVERRAKRRKGLLNVKLRDHFIILGWNIHATSLIKSLTQGEKMEGIVTVCVNPLDPEAFQDATAGLELGDRLRFVRGNPAQESVLSRASPKTARQAYIICPEDVSPDEADQQSLLVALTFKGMAPKTPLFAEVRLLSNRPHLTRAGVDEIICRGEVTCRIMGAMGSHPITWNLIHALTGADGKKAIGFRMLHDDERGLSWSGLVSRTLEKEGALPLALCRLKRDITLEDIMDQDSALDNYILQLFNMYGQETALGQQGPAVLVNPDDSADLSAYDGVLFLLKGGQSK